MGSRGAGPGGRQWVSGLSPARTARGDLVSYLILHTGQASSFGGCMAQASYLDTARRLASFLAKKARFVTTSKVRSCHKATMLITLTSRRDHNFRVKNRKARN